MKEKINDFNQIIENYYNEKGMDVCFHFLHIITHYTYLDLHHEYIDGNDNWKTKEKVERINESQRIFVPVIMECEYYEKNYNNKDYDREMFPIEIKDKIDIGDTDNFNYDEFYKKIYDNIPKECTVVSDEELDLIAKLNDYDEFEWDIYDASVGKPPIAYVGPEWHYDIYGIKKSLHKGI